jgi:formiminotetrahydrofolate cyclodeaminase
MGESFLEELGKAQPNPGGGAASAYGATVALALVEKVVKLELQRPHNAQKIRLFWEENLARVHRLSADLGHLREADVEAYLNLARARRQGGQDLMTAIEEAIGCPQVIMEKASLALEAVSAAAEHCQRHLISDLQVACEFLGAALEGAYHIGAANLPLIASPSLREDYAGKLSHTARQGRENFVAVRKKLAASTLNSGGI